MSGSCGVGSGRNGADGSRRRAVAFEVDVERFGLQRRHPPVDDVLEAVAAKDVSLEAELLWPCDPRAPPA